MNKIKVDNIVAVLIIILIMDINSNNNIERQEHPPDPNFTINSTSRMRRNLTSLIRYSPRIRRTYTRQANHSGTILSNSVHIEVNNFHLSSFIPAADYSALELPSTRSIPLRRPFVPLTESYCLRHGLNRPLLSVDPRLATILSYDSLDSVDDNDADYSGSSMAHSIIPQDSTISSSDHFSVLDATTQSDNLSQSELHQNHEIDQSRTIQAIEEVDAIFADAIYGNSENQTAEDLERFLLGE